MASTITLQNTINFALPYVQFRPLAIGTANEPAITIANTVLQMILGPPFCWAWNRSTSLGFQTVAGQQDYTQALTNFGFLESMTVNGFQVEIIKVISATTPGLGLAPGLARPTHVAVAEESVSEIVFNFLPTPDAVYTIDAEYQFAAPLIASLTDIWAPIPDRYSYIYQFGFLSLAMAYADDPRFAQFSQMFKGHLLGASEGLDEMQKSVFMERWDRVTGNTQATALRTQQGVQARAL